MISPTHCLVNVENVKNQDQVCSPVRAQWTMLTIGQTSLNIHYFLEKLFGCLHVYCLECMGKLIQSSAEPEKVLCPICHCLTPLDLVAENKFGTNCTLVR